MLWTPVIILLGTWVSCSRSQTLLAQPPSVAALPTQNVKIPCTLSTGKAFDIYRVMWIQQRLGSAPRLVYHFRIGSTEGKGLGIPDRFSVSAEASKRLWNLDITGVQAEDDAEYYCATWFDETLGWIFGGGTQLNVLSGETKAPALNIFPPSSEEVATSKATLVCTMEDFYPGSVTVTWKADGAAISSGVETTRPSKQSGNNLFMASSFLTVPAVDWSGGKKYTCQATHESKIIEKSVKHSECV